MTIKKINHVAIAVKDIEAALDFWESKLGLKLDYIEEVPSEASRVAFIPIGDSLIELVQPTRDDTGMAAYLENVVRACIIFALKFKILMKHSID